jgi:SAM-dependent methyltransferase
MEAIMPRDPSFFENLSFEDFQRLALDPGLSVYEKVGFPDAYRAEHEERIYADIQAKVPALTAQGSRILDIGCGCSDLPRWMMRTAQVREQQLFLLDSAEMLGQLPDGSERASSTAVPAASIVKIAAKFPDCPELLREAEGRLDAIVTYSVLQYVFADGNVFRFVDEALGLLAPGGRLLIGDIPNISMRKRFFGSDSGVAHHRVFTRTADAVPEVRFNRMEPAHIDDAVVFAILGRARAAGFHGYVLPQSPELPMANRREDILIVRP